eukprot:9564162-Prorocentrum_lima.AAC.1
MGRGSPSLTGSSCLDLFRVVRGGGWCRVMHTNNLLAMSAATSTQAILFGLLLGAGSLFYSMHL